jgi:hypothetical protein
MCRPDYLFECRAKLVKEFGADLILFGSGLDEIGRHLPKSALIDAAIITAPSDEAVHAAHKLVGVAVRSSYLPTQ